MFTEKPKHIFIVEDNEIYSMMLDYILSKNSIYKLISFKSGEECIKNLYLNPDVIILDYGLPGMNGYDTLLEIKKQNPGIRVVVLTNHEDEKLKNELLIAGADDYILKKDLAAEQVIEKVEDILNEVTIENGNHPSSKNKFLYFVLIALLLALGVYYYV